MTRESELVAAVDTWYAAMDECDHACGAQPEAEADAGLQRAILALLHARDAYHDAAPAQVEGEAVRLWVRRSKIGYYATSEPPRIYADAPVDNSVCVVSFRLPPPSPPPEIAGEVSQ